MRGSTIQQCSKQTIKTKVNEVVLTIMGVESRVALLQVDAYTVIEVSEAAEARLHASN